MFEERKLPSLHGPLGYSWRLGKQAMTASDGLQVLAVRAYGESGSGKSCATFLVGENTRVGFAFDLQLTHSLQSGDSIWYSLGEISPCCGAERSIARNTVRTNPFASKFAVEPNSCCNRAYSMPGDRTLHTTPESMVNVALNTTSEGSQILTNFFEQRFTYYANPLMAAFGAINVTAQIEVMCRGLFETKRDKRKTMWEDL